MKWLLAVLPAFAADLLLVNGNVYTVNPAQPRAQAVLCRDGRIVAVGGNDDVRKQALPGARVIDLRGRLTVPGFNDAHVHFYDGGRNLASVQLRDAKSPEEFRARIAAYAKSIPKGTWILGGDWDHENWTPAALPTRALIDDVTPDHPVFVQRLDGHMALVNSKALALAGVRSEVADPPGGAVVRDARGGIAGVLKDAAMGLVGKAIPAPGPEQISTALRAAMKYAARNGVTSVQDMSASPAVLRVYQRLLDAGELTVRVSGHQPLDSWRRLAQVGVRAGFGNDKLRIGALKGFSDGSLGSTTALFFDVYSDAPSTAGLPADDMIPESKMLDNIVGADKAGLQIAIHAIGDKANATVLDLFAKAAAANGERDRRFRIEHAQHLRKQEIARFAAQRVIASMQPYHAIDDGRWADKRIGPERAKGTYAFRSLLDAGATLAFGSDWFVAPMEPLMGIYAAVTRRTLDGKRPEGWVPEQKITVAEAIRAYTMGSAFASFEEKVKGSIEPGKYADLAVISDDLFTIAPEKIAEARVAMTIFDGRLVFE